IALPFGRSRLGHVTVLNQEHVLRHASPPSVVSRVLDEHEGSERTRGQPASRSLSRRWYEVASADEGGAVAGIYGSTTSAYVIGFDEETAVVSRLSALLDVLVAAICVSAVPALRVLDSPAAIGCFPTARRHLILAEVLRAIAQKERPAIEKSQAMISSRSRISATCNASRRRRTVRPFRRQSDSSCRVSSRCIVAIGTGSATST